MDNQSNNASSVSSSRTTDGPFASAPASANAPGFAIAKPGWGTPAWAGTTSHIAVGPFTLKAPFVFVGRNLPARWAAGVDLTLPVDSDGLAARPAASTYAQLTSRQRRAFLGWLQRDRTEPLGDEAFLRVFLANAEEYLLAPGASADAAQVDAAERVALLDELQQLAHRYAVAAGAQADACGELHDFVRLRALELTGKRAYEDTTFTQVAAQRPSSVLRFALGHLLEDGKPLPARWAYQWARALLKRNEVRTLQLCQEPLKRLFIQKYVQAHGAGIALPAGSQGQLVAAYNPVNPSLSGMKWELRSSAAVMPYSPQVTTPLIVLLTQCFQELQPYIGCREQGTPAADCWHLLPITLWPEEHRLAFRSIVQKALEGPTVSSYVELAPFMRLEQPFGKKALALVHARLDELGLHAVPDLQGELRPTTPEAPLVLLAQDEDCALTESLNDFVSLLRVCAPCITEEPGDPVVAALNCVLDTGDLTRSERSCRRAYLELVRHSGLKKLTPAAFSKLDDERRKTITDLARAAFAGLPALKAPLSKFFGDQWFRVVPPTLRLDTSRVAQLVQETDRVQVLLGSVFVDDSTTASLADNSLAIASPAAPASGAKSTFLIRLAAQSLWSQAQLQALADALGLMLGGTLEWANEQAYDLCGVPLLEEDGGGWAVDAGVLAEVLAQAGT
jgi:hypothetical protein